MAGRPGSYLPETSVSGAEPSSFARQRALLEPRKATQSPVAAKATQAAGWPPRRPCNSRVWGSMRTNSLRALLPRIKIRLSSAEGNNTEADKGPVESKVGICERRNQPKDSLRAQTALGDFSEEARKT